LCEYSLKSVGTRIFFRLIMSRLLRGGDGLHRCVDIPIIPLATQN
jgi:hypothetical protein